ASVHLLSLDELLPTLSVGGGAIGNVLEEPWVQMAMEQDGRGIWIPSSAKGPTGALNSPALGYTRIIKDQGTFSASYLYLMELKEPRLQEIIGGALGDGGHLYVLDESGNIVSSDDRAEIGMPFHTT